MLELIYSPMLGSLLTPPHALHIFLKDHQLKHVYSVELKIFTATINVINAINAYNIEHLNKCI